MMCPYPVRLAHPQSWGDSLFVGCGKCGACNHNRRTDWMFRMEQELKESGNALFLTLTYDQGCLPLSDNGLPTLETKPVIAEFIKAIRQKQASRTEAKMKHVMVGEYGTKSKRPHYHLVLFNVHTDFFDGVEFLRTWEKGIPHIVKLNGKLIHYISKYHVTANKQKIRDYEDDRIPEWFNCSNGIGEGYVERNKTWHLENQANYVINNGHKQRMPRYYWEKIFGLLTDENKKVLTDKTVEHVEKATMKEWARLKALGHKDPERELLYRHYYASKNVKRKSTEKEKI